MASNRNAAGFIYPHHHELREALGLPVHRLPAEGMEPKLVRVCGRMVWFYVVPQKPLKPHQRRRMEHRVFAICPTCHKHVPASRLAQHEGTAACHALYCEIGRHCRNDDEFGVAYDQQCAHAVEAARDRVFSSED